MDATLKHRINLLIQLALIDNELDIRERAFIYNVCIRNGVDLDTIGDMIDAREPIPDLSQLALQERIDYMTDCLMLTMIDAKVLPKEIALVTHIADQLGFRQEQLDNLIANLASDIKITRTELRDKVAAIVQR